MTLLLLMLACTAGDPAGDGDGGASDGGASDGGVSDGGADGGGDAGTDGGSVTPGEWVQVAGASATGADIAIADDGAIYLSWVHGHQVLLAVSTDRGQSFSEPVVAVPDGAWSSAQTHPNLAVSGDRIALAAPSTSVMRLYLSARDPLAFGDPVLIGHDADLKYETIFLTVHAAPDDSFWAGFHAFPSGSGWSGGWKGVAREDNGWALEEASTGAPGEPCECCPQDLAFAPDGSALLAFRNNIDNVRDSWIARSDSSGAFGSWSELGAEGWTINYCPVQGPRLATDDDAVLVVWPEASTGPWRSHTRRSDDGGVTWGAVADIPTQDDANQRSPTLVLSGDNAWLGTVSGYETGAQLSSSTDGGRTWSAPVEVVGPDGRLEMVELAAGDGLVGMVGAVEEGDGVWFQLLDGAE